MQSNYDFNTPIEKTSVYLAKIILGKINDKKDDLVFNYAEPKMPREPRMPVEPVQQDTTDYTDEQRESYNASYEKEVEKFTEAQEAYLEAMAKYKDDMAEYDALIAENQRRMEVGLDLSIDIMKEISKSDITLPYATRCLDKIQIVLESVKKYIDGTISQHRHEYASRSLGAKAPDNGRYTEECSTVGNLVLKLEEVRQSQGNKKSEYYDVEDEDLSTDTANVAEKKD